MRLPLGCLVAVLLFAPLSSDAGVPACPPPTADNLFIVYNGPVSHCSELLGACTATETIQFNVATFGFTFSCGTYMLTWNFGDGGTGAGLAPTHAYASPGSYTVTMTLVDPLGHSVTLTTQVTVTAAAPVPATSATTLALLAAALGLIAAVRLAAR